MGAAYVEVGVITFIKSTSPKQWSLYAIELLRLSLSVLEQPSNSLRQYISVK